MHRGTNTKGQGMLGTILGSVHTLLPSSLLSLGTLPPKCPPHLFLASQCGSHLPMVLLGLFSGLLGFTLSSLKSIPPTERIIELLSHGLKTLHNVPTDD